jgi:tRNA-specific 2-thiouridylase
MKVVVLYSGGLDSTVAYHIVKEWGAQIYPLYIYNKFLSQKQSPSLPGLKIADITKDFIDIVRSPQHGYGKNLNPCIDCRILMLKKAKQYMQKTKSDFIVTGEVLDQRPMSQRFEQLMLIEKSAGVEGMVVRPLSGALLPLTTPEKNHLINHNDLLSIKGRSRKMLFSMVQKMKIEQFSSPGGGCLLTDPGFCRRLADLMRTVENIEIRDIELLKMGRHFRLASDTKLIVGRDEEENENIEKISKPNDLFIYVPDTGSPNAILIGNKKFLKTAALITARYSDKKDQKSIGVFYKDGKSTKKIRVKPATNEELAKWRI